PRAIAKKRPNPRTTRRRVGEVIEGPPFNGRILVRWRSRERRAEENRNGRPTEPGGRELAAKDRSLTDYRLSRYANPCVPVGSVYAPTMSRRELIPNTCVLIAPWTSRLRYSPCFVRRKPRGCTAAPTVFARLSPCTPTMSPRGLTSQANVKRFPSNVNVSTIRFLSAT